eukprot:14524661-Alexandrium_andersonii.AAC.1
MAKAPGSWSQPRNHRVLTLLSAVYRMWAKVRATHMRDWARTWDLREIHAGTSERCAETAWFQTAGQMEECALSGTQ